MLIINGMTKDITKGFDMTLTKIWEIWFIITAHFFSYRYSLVNHEPDKGKIKYGMDMRYSMDWQTVRFISVWNNICIYMFKK